MTSSFLQMPYNTHLDLMSKSRLGYGNTVQVMETNMIYSWTQVSNVILNTADQFVMYNIITLCILVNICRRTD